MTVDFSYLKTVSTLVDKVIYQRGLKHYLDGKVIKCKTLLIGNWKEYEVLGNSDVYFVKIPLLHELLPIEKFETADKALEESATCTCPYFEIYGICKHIIAVCSNLDNEINKKKVNKEIVFKTLKDFEKTEKQKKYSKWLNSLDYYLNVSDANNSQNLILDSLEDMIREVFTKPAEHEEFLEKTKAVIDQALNNYTKEKRVINIIGHQRFIFIGGNPWWNFWTEFIEKIENNREKLWLKLWLAYRDYPAIFWDFETRFIDKLKKLDEQTKKDIIKDLKDEVDEEGLKKELMDFSIIAEYPPYISKNLDILDPRYLVKVSQLIPDKTEEIEYRLANQIKIWSDFLQTGQYDEIVQIFEKWETKIGRSEIFEATKKYVKESHKKKKKLIKMLGE